MKINKVKMQPQYITDDNGNKIAVILKIKDYKKMIEDLEELEDIRMYDKVKKEDDGIRISFNEYMKKRKT